MYIFDSRFDEFNVVRNLETLRSISSRRIADTRNFMEFLSLQSVIRMKIKKELGGGRDSKRTGARRMTERDRKEVGAKFGRQGDGGKAKSNLIHTISSRRIGGPCNRVRIVGTSFWRVGRTWQNILHFRDEVSCDCNFATTFISR